MTTKEIKTSTSKYLKKEYITWYHKDTVMPDLHEYVIIETKYCKYKRCVGFYNGVNWISADDKNKIQNVEYWSKINY
jgi:hypothetical protein